MIGPANLKQIISRKNKQAISETDGMQKIKKSEPVGSPGAIYLLLSAKGWRGREVGSSGGSESEERKGGLSAGD